jgi:hypothetical protein
MAGGGDESIAMTVPSGMPAVKRRPHCAWGVQDEDAGRRAAERRLFYVASTWARLRAFVLANASKPPPFVTEILGDFAYEKEVLGRIERHSGDYGVFHGCSNFLVCISRTRLAITRSGRGRSA